jgi:hypothetical protein
MSYFMAVVILVGLLSGIIGIVEFIKSRQQRGFFFIIVTLGILIGAFFLRDVSATTSSNSPNASNGTSNSSTSLTNSVTQGTGITPTPTIVPATPTPHPNPSVLYQADWSQSMNGWRGSSEWKTLNGDLLSTGNPTNMSSSGVVAPNGGDSAWSPYQPQRADYAIEARIQILSSPGTCWVTLLGRVQTDNCGYDGYSVGYDSYYGYGVIAYYSPSTGWTPINSSTFDPGSDWHTYRAELKGNQITLKIDGNTILQVMDNRLLQAGQVGLGNGECQIDVSSFKSNIARLIASTIKVVSLLGVTISNPTNQFTEPCGLI